MQATRIAIAPAHGGDAPAIAKLHAESWRLHYRNAYSDSYLDGGLDADRLAVWTKRLAEADGQTLTLVAQQDDQLIGFVHAQLRADPVWGTLIDNLHVRAELHRMKIGSRLLDRAAKHLLQLRRHDGVYLWVLQQNLSARAFYTSRGGRICTLEPVEPPGGDPRNLDGTPAKLRMAWSNPEALLLQEVHGAA